MPDVIEVWADTGKVVERDFTPEELAQREEDRINAEIAKTKRLEEETAAAEARAAAIAHVRSLGFTDDMIKVLYPNLIIEENTEEV